MFSFKNLFGFKKSKSLNHQDIIQDWINKGKPLPPPHPYKQLLINNVKKELDFDIFIETGTYLGEMVEAQIEKFKKIYSIELSFELYSNAKQKFSEYEKVKIIHGDSGQVLKVLIKEISEPAIFWLDGHYSAGITAKGEKECPIFEELEAIFSGNIKQHVILIDDARLFIGENDYPTKSQLEDFVKSYFPDAKFLVEDDVIMILLNC